MTRMSRPALLPVIFVSCVFISLSSAKLPVQRQRRSQWWWGKRPSSSSYQDDSCIQTCYNGGVCYDTNKCRCTSQYRGPTCETAICNPSCGVRGSCVLPNICQCSTGYEGKRCDSAICMPKCLNGGKCTSPGVCKCGHQYTGRTCEQAICQRTCLNRGKCTSPDVCTCVTGYAGVVCESAICSKPCLNGGSCIAPDVCACAPGYLGSACELGGDPSSFLTPSHYLADERTGQLLSWYEEEPLSTFGKICFVKVEILNADVETLLTATSYTSAGEFLGNYTVGGVDTHMRSRGNDRAACLEIRCPSDLHETSVVVNVTIATSRQTCHVVNQTSSAYDRSNYDGSGNQEITFQVHPHRDYGSRFGIYIAYGLRQRMKYACEKMCRSGTNMGWNDVVPHDGIAVTYICK